uniref:Uncharacterized protein n=1 Tax=Arundo donax TaxID=35708 RepID=A0A0A9CHM9_ARUDO
MLINQSRNTTTPRDPRENRPAAHCLPGARKRAHERPAHAQKLRPPTNLVLLRSRTSLPPPAPLPPPQQSAGDDSNSKGRHCNSSDVTAPLPNASLARKGNERESPNPNLVTPTDGGKQSSSKLAKRRSFFAPGLFAAHHHQPPPPPASRKRDQRTSQSTPARQGTAS